MKVLKDLGNKKYLITYAKILQIASAADQLASKKTLETPQLVGKKFLFSWMWPTKSSKNNFFAAHAIGNGQHDDVQNERSLGMNLSQLNENRRKWMKKGGYPT